MACRYTYLGKTYEAHEFDDVLRAMKPAEASKHMPGVQSIPDAPMIGKTDAWVSLAIKRVIKLAVDGSYDKVAFVNGEQSAARYSLDKQVDSVNWKSERVNGGTKTVEITLPGQNPLRLRLDENANVLEANGPGFAGTIGKPLDDIIGKEIAAKVMGESTGNLAGDGLKIEAKGMRIFYDSVVPSVTKEVLRKLGGGQLETVNITTGNPPQGESGWGKLATEGTQKTVAQTGFSITPAMREHASKGMPMFEPKSDYNQFRGQLDLFLNSKPDPSQAGARPDGMGKGIEVARRDAAVAVEDLHATSSVLGKALSSDLAARQRTSLAGQTVADHADLATLSQVYRDPRFETFRIVFTDKNDRVVSQVGVTSRLPGSVDVILGPDMAPYVGDLAKTAKQSGATSYSLLHNHPSGQARPSAEDEKLTRNFDKEFAMQGLAFKGHVVIDTNEYALINHHGDSTIIKKDFGQVAPMLHSEFGNFKISGPADIMRMAKQLEVDTGAVTLIVTDHQYRTRAITTLPSDAISSNQSMTRLNLLKAVMRNQGSMVFAVSRNESLLRNLGGMVVDGVYVAKDGSMKSLTALGVIKSSGAFPESRRTRISPDTSPEFNYLREATQQGTAYKVAEPDIPFGDTERKDIPDTAHAGVLSNLIHQGLTSISEGVDKIGNKTGVYDAIAPMSAGTQKTRALAQNWINDSRKADFTWKKIDDHITKTFTPEQRTKMWNAADEENDMRRVGEDSTGTGKGLDGLTPTERGVLDQLHNESQALWERAKAVGMVKGEGVDYWTPRMMVEIGENGSYTRPGEGKQGTSEGVGRNFSTSAGSAKQRKYDTAAETEAAMKAKGGEMVRDIRTMPMAMAKLEKAIASRELINQIKELGAATGNDFFRTTESDGFFTLDHPAFRQNEFRAIDGKQVLVQTPIYISNDFKGPLKAILGQGFSNNKLYTGFMLLKSKAMSTIMYSPLIHGQVIFGRALAYGGIKTPTLYFSGAKNDIPFMQKMIGAGMVPIGNHNSMLDVGDIANGKAKEGGWMDQNESWIGLGAQKLGNMAKSGLGDTIKGGIDKAGDFWHNKMLWDRVGDLQAGIAKNAYDKLIVKGFDENAATTVAAHLANRYAGAVGKENMSEFMHITANIALFSKSFNAGNVGTVKDAFYGLPAGLKAQLMEKSDANSAINALSFAKKKAFIGLVRDLSFAIALTSLAQDWFRRDKEKGFVDNAGDALDGYQQRAMDAWANAKENPFAASSYNPYRLSSTFTNEPDKQNRIDMGPDEAGRHQFMRLPTGKVVEDLLGWSMHPFDTFGNKKSPFLSAVQRLNNEKDKWGTPVWDENGTIPEKAFDIAKSLVGTQVPTDQIQTAHDIATGHGTDLDTHKIFGNFTGLTVSQGHPQGPEAAVASKVEERVSNSKKYAMEMAKYFVKTDQEDRARELLDKAGLTPQEVNQTINRLTNPLDRMTKTQQQKFRKHANQSEIETMDSVSR
jgi:RadC-like JAB domain